MREGGGLGLLAALAALGTLGSWGCTERVTTAPVVDLVAGFPLARHGVETTHLDFGTPEARSVLVSGWSRNYRGAGQTSTFVANTGRRGEVELEVVEPRDLELTLAGRSLRSGPAPRLSVELNGEPLGEITMNRGGESPYRMAVPAGKLRIGPNRLAIVHPLPEGATNVARVAWYGIKLGEIERRGGPAVVAERNLHVLPAGTSVEYLVDLPGGSFLSVENWQFRGDPPTAVEVMVETDEEGSRTAAVVTTERRDSRIDLGLPGDRVARLRLRTLRLDSASADASVALTGPVVEVTAAAARRSQSERRVAALKPVERRPNVIIYLIDTLRADHLGCYGYPRGTSPNIDRLAERATVYDRAVAQSSWTRASVASVLTGVGPEAHGAVGRRDRLVEDATTLAEVLGRSGYQTAAIVANPNVYRSFGFDQGFDRFVQLMGNFRGSRVVTKGARELIAEFDRDRPFFLYLHTIDPHHPYLPTEELRRKFAPDSDALLERVRKTHRKELWVPEEAPGLSALYDAEIAHNDERFGELIDFLEAEGLFDSTLIVFTSDHGEEFYDHGSWGHGKNLRAANLDVPLIVKFPGQTEARRSDASVQHIDLLPTVLEFAETPVPPHVEGLPLPRREDVGEQRDPLIFSHLRLDGPQSVSLTEGRWKLIQTWASGNLRVRRRQLFDKIADPGESHDLAGERPVLAAYLGSRIDAELLRTSYRLTAVEAEIDEELEKSLKALGYLQ